MAEGEQEGGGRELVQQRPAVEHEGVGPSTEAPAPGPLAPVTDARGPGSGMRDTLEGMDAVSRHRMVTDMQRRAGNVAVQSALGEALPGSIPSGKVVVPAAPAAAAAVRAPAARSARRGKAGDEEGDGRAMINALFGSLLDGGGTSRSGAVGRAGPSAASGTDEDGPPAGRRAGTTPRLFRPGGYPAGEKPEDRTALTAAELDAILEVLWRDGVFRHDADRLNALVPRADGLERATELRAFALLAALNERVAVVALDFPIEPAAAAPGALWLAAGAWRQALVDDVEAVPPGDLEAAVASLAAAADDRTPAVVAWAAIARAERAALDGDIPGAGALLDEVAAGAAAPAGAAVAAGLRCGLLAAFTDPAGARERLAAAGERAAEAGHPVDAAHIDTRLALLELLDGDRDAAADRSAAVLTLDAQAEPADARLGRVVAQLAGGRAKSAAGAVRDLADQAAVAGDYLVAAGSLVACARAQRRGGGADGAVDALGTLFTGIGIVARAFGPGTAGPLEFERDDLAATLGPEGFKTAMRIAVERMERRLQQRTGPAAPPS